MEQDVEKMAQQMRRNYYRQWRATHKENVKRHNQNFWRKRAEQERSKENGTQADIN